LIGGTGNDLFYVSHGSQAGTTIIGGSGMNTLRDDYVTDIWRINISGRQT